MVSIQFQAEPPKEKKTSTTTAFHYDGNKQSPYQKDGKPLTWLAVQAEVGEVMKARNIPFSSSADLQHKLPALIFTLLDEIDDLTAQLVEKPKSKK